MTDSRVEEVKSVKNTIERDVKQEYGGILERLKNSEGQKVAILMHDLQELQKDVDRIDYIVNHCNTLIGNNNLKEFLSDWKNIHATLEHSLTKPFKTTIDVIPHDMPRELAEKIMVLDKFNCQHELLSLKDELIYKLINEKS